VNGWWLRAVIITHLRFLGVGTLLSALCMFLVGVSGDSHAVQRADAFMLLIKDHSFEQAAKAFFYPPYYTPEKLARDEATIAEFLESLFKVAGDLKEQARTVPSGSSTWWQLGISGGDKPYTPSEIGADRSEIVYYEGRSTKEGKALIILTFVHIPGNWQRFDFGIPRSADDTPAHFEQFARRVLSGCRACQPHKET
jgi:hypothetical protein